ncbi:MAG: hypothetical protein NVS4B8_26660 [Herpetosiphon sp.]
MAVLNITVLGLAHQYPDMAGLQRQFGFAFDHLLTRTASLNPA